MKIDGLDDGVFWLSEATSLNNKLLLETYKKGELRAKVENGFARLDQKVTLKGLKVLVAAKLQDGTYVTKGSTAYIKEEALHTQQWAQKSYSVDTLETPFIVVDASQVEFILPFYDKVRPAPLSPEDQAALREIQEEDSK